MFTGIVEEMGKVKATGQNSLTVAAAKVLEDVKLGDSIAVNGVCLTVIEFDKSSFTISLMPETLRRSNLGALHVGDAVNLERAVAVGSRMGGHYVQGHVDAKVRVVSMQPEGDALLVRLAAPPELMRYIVPKGFVAIDGTSLTVVDCDGETFSVSLVSYTQENIVLAKKRPGYEANLEVDILGKYVEKLVCPPTSKITEELLAENGFLS